MKKVSVLTIFFCTLIFVCIAASTGRNREREESLPANPARGIFTGGIVAVSGETIIHMTEPVTVVDYDDRAQKKNSKNDEMVIDETGQKRELKLGHVNAANKEILIQKPNSFVEYAQAADGHYYYLRKEGENCYTLYCDRSIRIGSFRIESGYYFQGCCKYNGWFYVILYHYTAGSDIYDGYSVLTAADFTTGKLRTIRKIENVEDYEAYFYKDKIRLYYSPDYVCEDVDEEEDDGRQPVYQYDIMGSEEPGSDIEYRDFIMDGYRYYVKGRKEVRILRKCLEGKSEEEEVFRYQTKREKNPGETVVVSLDIDNTDMFIKEWVLERDEMTERTLLYVVPRAGGKMKMVTDDLGFGDYVYNSQYIFWDDESFKLHKWNRRTQKEETVIKLPSDDSDYYWNANCTERDLYISRENLYGSIYCYPWLYYMGINDGTFQVIYDTDKSLGESYDESYGDGYR